MRTYKNPILYCDYSDPDAIRVGENYFMVASSFTNTPGLPLLHSYDLVHWEIINYCIKNVPDASYDKNVRHGCGVWAPSIRFNNGTYYVCFPMPDEGIFMTTTTDPYGEWSTPINIRPGKGWIDPCPFFDDDGKVYLVSGVAKSRIGYNNVLYISEMSSDAMSLIGEPIKIFDGNESGHRTTEGPKLYKRNGYYYVFAPAGGVKPGYQLVLRSKKIYGPYESRIVLAQGKTSINGPHQGAFVDTITGEDWFIHFRDVYAAGRITYLEPMRWIDDWPIIGNPIIKSDGSYEQYGEPVSEYTMPSVNRYDKPHYEVSDSFANGKMNYAWQFNGNHKDNWTHVKENKGLVMKAVYDNKITSFINQNNVLLQKWPAPEFVSTFTVDICDMEDGDYMGIVTIGMEYGALEICKEDGKYILKKITGHLSFEDSEPFAHEKAEIITTDTCSDLSQVHFSYKVISEGTRQDEECKSIPVERILFETDFGANESKICLDLIATAGRWVGAKFGIFCSSHNTNSKGSITLRTLQVTSLHSGFIY